MEIKLILTELRLFKLNNFFGSFYIIKSTSSMVYSSSFLNKAYILWT